MSERGGPDRRRAPRHRAGKPYAKEQKLAVLPKVCPFALPRSQFLMLCISVVALITVQHFYCSI